MYWSRYAHQWLQTRALELAHWPQAANCWCIFDNTASGAAIANALELQAVARSLEMHQRAPK